MVGKRIARLARADDDGVVFHVDGPPGWNGPKDTIGCNSSG
jgi:hypothetical protein